MISRNVICAIIILNELYCASPDKRTGNKVLDRSALMLYNSLGGRTFRRVIQQLHVGKYIDLLRLTCTERCGEDFEEVFERITVSSMRGR